MNIYGTAHTAGVNTLTDAGYAIANVFGGGKNANYTVAGKVATVNVFGCDNTIGRVFGGGDAAAVSGTSVDLQGGRFNYVFGGGNGEVTAANVGASGIDLAIHGGTIGTLVSGSNTQGTISGPINVNVDNVGGCTEEVTDFFRDEANDLILDYEKPGKKELQYENDISKAMSVDVNRGHYTIAGKRFSMRPAAEVLEAFGKIVTVPKAKRALTILMSQASALPVLSMQMKFTVPPNDHRPQPLDPATLAGSSEFVSRGIADPQLFMAQQIVDDVTSIFDLSVSEDGATATLKIVKSANLVVGTDEHKMKTHFGSVVVEEEVTVDLTTEVPTVTNVRVAQRFDDSSDLQARYLAETEPIPAPPPVPPAPVPGPAPVPNAPAV